MSCRVAMLRMHRDGLIPLPAPRRRHSNGTLHRRRTPRAEPELPIIARVDALPALQVRPLADQREAQLWREYVDRYHYLGYTPLPGAQMRYLVTSQRRVLAVVGFGASAWKAAPRDRFIGWSVAQREARLQLVDARFLILPWVRAISLPRCWHAAAAACPTTGRFATATDRSCWRPSCSPTASPVPATAPPTGPMSVRPKAAANSTAYPRAAQERHRSTRSGATSAADSAPRSILTPTGRTNVYAGQIAKYAHRRSFKPTADRSSRFGRNHPEAAARSVTPTAAGRTQPTRCTGLLRSATRRSSCCCRRTASRCSAAGLRVSNWRRNRCLASSGTSSHASTR